jgi:hypothetical protein
MRAIEQDFSPNRRFASFAPRKEQARVPTYQAKMMRS